LLLPVRLCSGESEGNCRTGDIEPGVASAAGKYTALFKRLRYGKISLSRYKRKETDDMKSYEELAEEQGRRESSFLSNLGEAELRELSDFETGVGKRREEILFKITTEIEDTTNALNQVEQLSQRLKKYLERLKKIHQTLSK
jgi:hypothetical protein